jgi:hypothetical protein
MKAGFSQRAAPFAQVISRLAAALSLLITELAQTSRAALGSWHRTGQLCALILAIALGLALVLWITGK